MRKTLRYQVLVPVSRVGREVSTLVVDFKVVTVEAGGWETTCSVPYSGIGGTDVARLARRDTNNVLGRNSLLTSLACTNFIITYLCNT